MGKVLEGILLISQGLPLMALSRGGSLQNKTTPSRSPAVLSRALLGQGRTPKRKPDIVARYSHKDASTKKFRHHVKPGVNPGVSQSCKDYPDSYNHQQNRIPKRIHPEKSANSRADPPTQLVNVIFMANRHPMSTLLARPLGVLM